MKEETTYGLSPERLARLLRIGLKSNDRKKKATPSRTPSEVLRDMLESKLPIDPAMLESLQAVLRRPCNEVLPVAGRTIRELLLDFKTDLAVVRTVKDYAKGLARRRGPEAKRAAGKATYYAAAASALVFHQKKITKHAYEKLEEAYGDFEQKKWIPPDLKDLFKKAKAACQERKG